MRTPDFADVTASSSPPGAAPVRKRAPMVMAPPPEVPGGGSALPELVAFAAEAMARPEGAHEMGLDAAMRREMRHATRVLAPRTGATHVAVQDGTWSTATTWVRVSDGLQAVPGAGAHVLIPSGVAVTYDIVSDALIQTIRIDGEFLFPSDADTRLTVDTIIQDHGTMAAPSRFQIGAEAQPVAADRTCEIVFPGDTDIDIATDVLALGRGIIAMGKVFIYGAEKTPYGRCSTFPALGATSITLDEAPTGWRVGDSICIGASDYNPGSREERFDDHVTITSISGAIITFTPALAYARVKPPDARFADVTIKVGNFTRNVTFRSPEGTPGARRGHLMFMHDEVVCRYAASDWMGRTNKVLPNFAYIRGTLDATNDDERVVLKGGDLPFEVADIPRIRGRYNWHLHKAGTRAGQPYAEMVGLAASESPGWLYAHHSSFANFRYCVGRKFEGSGMMAEVGDEIGLWQGNLMMSAYAGFGSGRSFNEKTVGMGEIGRYASGFWGRSRNIIMQDCIAVGCNSGFVWNSRDFVGAIRPVRAANTFEPRAFYFAAEAGLSVEADKPPIPEFRRNEVAACEYGIVVIKAGPNQGHLKRSFFGDYLAWNVRGGIEIEYTGHYSFENPRILRTEPTTQSTAWGFLIGPNGTDIAIHGGCVVGWSNPIHFIRREREDFVTGDAPLHIVADVDLDGGQVIMTGEGLKENFPDYIIELDAADLTAQEGVIYNTPGGVHLDQDADMRIVFRGTYTDKAGTAPVLQWNNNKFWNSIPGNTVNRGLQQMGYWTYGGRNWLLVPFIISQRIANPAGDLPPTYMTVPVRLQLGQSVAGITNNGPLGAPYVVEGVVQPVVYEDILG